MGHLETAAPSGGQDATATATTATATTATATTATATAARRAAIGPALAGTATIAVCYGLARFAYGLFVPTFRAAFGLDAATAGAVASGSYLAYCVGIVAATAATTRWGPRRVAAAAGACAAVGTAVIAAAPTVAVLAGGVVLAGSSTGLASPPLADAVARTAPSRLEPRLQTLVNAGTGLGVVVSGPVALLLAGHWRWAWAAFSAGALVVTLWTWSVLPRDAGRVGSPVGSATPGRSSVPRGVAGLLVAAVLTGLGSSAVWTFGRDLVDAASGGGPTGVVMWIALGAAGLLGACAGDLTTRLGLPRCWSAAMALLAGATALLALAASVPAAAVLAGALFGAVYIGLTGLLLLWGTRVFPRRPVFGVGAAFLVLAAGQALGAPVVGAVADAITLPGAFLAAAGVVVVGAVVRPRAR